MLKHKKIFMEIIISNKLSVTIIIEYNVYYMSYNATIAHYYYYVDN